MRTAATTLVALLTSSGGFAGPSPAWAAGEDAPRLVLQVGQGPILAVALSADGSKVLTGSWDGAAKLWAADREAQLRTFEGHAGGITAVAFMPGGRRVLTASVDGTARLWDTATAAQVRTFSHAKRVTAVAVSPDGRRILTASWDETARLWDAEDGTAPLREFTCQGSAYGVAFSPDGRRALIGCSREARLVDLATGGTLRSFEGSLSAFSRDGRRIVSASNSVARVWDAETGQLVGDLTGHTKAITSVELSKDGRRALTASQDYSARLWDVETGAELHRYAHKGWIGGATLSADGRRVLTGSWDKTAKLWDAETAKPLRTYTGRGVPIDAVSLSTLGRRLAVTHGATTTLWDAAEGKPIATLEGRSGAITPDGRWILTIREKEPAALWDCETGLQRVTFGAASQAALSPDGRRVVTAGDRGVILWDATSGKELRRLADRATYVAFSPDGQVVATDFNLWNAEGGERMGSVPGFRDPSDVAVSAGGRYVLASTILAGATLWDVPARREVKAFPCAKWGRTAAFSPDGVHALVGCRDGTAVLWNLESGMVVRTLDGHAGAVTRVAFSPDGRKILTGGFDRTVKLWSLDAPAALATLASFDDGTWAVADPEGRYDGSSDGYVPSLHYVVGDTVVPLSELKTSYWEPYLLAKVSGLNPEPVRPVQPLDPKPLPAVEITPPAPGGTVFRIRLRDTGGGIGEVRVVVNGKEVLADARGDGLDPRAAEATLEPDLAAAPVIPGEDNEVRVIASTRDGLRREKGVAVTWRPAGGAAPRKPDVYAIVCGTEYASDPLKLRFSGKDAADMAKAIRLAATRFVGADRLHLAVLTDYPGTPGAVAPTRENLRKAFEAARAAKPWDVLVVYLSGHGLVAPDDDYWYLTRDARSADDLRSARTRSQSGVSSAELREWSKAVAANKQVFVLDTCGAGGAARNLLERRAASGYQRLALENLRERTGVFLLAGAAADKPSYEATPYGQGLLTYALLDGIRGAALGGGDLVEIPRLLDYAADQVPRLARSVGGIQSPYVGSREAMPFAIGQLGPDDKAEVPLAVRRPVILRASVQRSTPPYRDTLGLEPRVNDALRDASVAAKKHIAFFDTHDYPGALVLAARYDVRDQQVQVEAYLGRGEAQLARFQVEGPVSDLGLLATKLVDLAIDAANVGAVRGPSVDDERSPAAR